MADTVPSQPLQSTVAELRRSAIGRMTGRVSHFFGRSLSMQATARFLRTQLWAWPIIAAVALAIVGWWVSRSVEEAMRQNRIGVLTTILDADIAALRVWIAEQQTEASLIARDENLRPLVQELLTLAAKGSDTGRDLIHAPAQSGLRARLKEPLRLGVFIGFFVVTPSGTVIAADQDAPVGNTLDGYRKEFFDGINVGGTAVSRPFHSPLLLTNERGELKSNLPSMFAAAPIRDDAGQPLAALGLRIRPEDQFTGILQVASVGKTGETYAFDRSGVFLSQSRFDDQLKQVGLLADQPDSRSILMLELRNPEVNLIAGERPKLRRSDQQFTQAAASAIAGQDGHNVEGYRDYRGVPVIGAWRWLPEFDFGVATEVDVAEAFRPLYVLRRAFWALMILLGLCAVGIYFAMMFMSHQQRELQKATLAAKQLGQYTLEEKLGEGGMGTVYRARHAMLRRPTAVKLLDLEKVSATAIARFEREVQLTSTLTHPNTIAVYDFGRTNDGIFYYAMEYLDGIDLDRLVEQFGPLSEARIVYILRQVCGSLAESHKAGLIHRDIKPANIFLTVRGGLYDFVKVLDFGLAKALEGREAADLTASHVVTGTPLYMSPEAVQRPEEIDARADVYGIGAVGYYLLTGSPVFTGLSVMEICMKHVNGIPDPPSRRFGLQLSADLEDLLMRCLAKSPSDRPADAGALLHELNACIVSGQWSADDAAMWWSERRLAGAKPEPRPETKGPPVVTPMPAGQITMEFPESD